MTRLAHFFAKSIYTIQALLFIGIPVLFIHGSSVSALFLSSRSIEISTGIPSATASHVVAFTYASTSIVGSIKITYCTNSPLYTDICTAPAGLSLNAANLTSQAGNSGFSIDNANSNANTFVLTRIAVPSLSIASSYTFSNVTNPSTTNQTTFVRIGTYASNDATGPTTDIGAAAFAINDTFQASAFVPPFIDFCVGITVSRNCTDAEGFLVDVGSLSRSQTKVATSQFSIGTNDAAGTIIFALGTTMLSGNNVIPASQSPLPSTTGNSQFGMNLRKNNAPSVGDEPDGGTVLPTINYGQPNRYTFEPGDAIATSTLPTDYSRLTASYIINISASQPAGHYGTTLTYLATVQF